LASGEDPTRVHSSCRRAPAVLGQGARDMVSASKSQSSP
jgi:hypothetical protein